MVVKGGLFWSLWGFTVIEKNTSPNTVDVTQPYNRAHVSLFDFLELSYNFYFANTLTTKKCLLIAQDLSGNWKYWKVHQMTGKFRKKSN